MTAITSFKKLLRRTRKVKELVSFRKIIWQLYLPVAILYSASTRRQNSRFVILFCSLGENKTIKTVVIKINKNTEYVLS